MMDYQRLLFASVMATMSCRGRAPAARSTRPTQQLAPPTTLNRGDASVVARPLAPRSAVNLIEVPGAAVEVSSTVANTHELPRHLIDHDPTTTWSSRTGELVGAWIRVTLPERVVVRELRLIVGYARTAGSQDLFTLNPRVKRLRVTHRGAPVGEFPLNIDRRDLQSIPLHGDGGEWRFEVAEIQPGARPSWREVCVSELQLLGDFEGAAHAAASSPEVTVAGAIPAPLPNTNDSAAALREAQDALRVALTGGNPEPGSTWYPHDKMMRYYRARGALANAGALHAEGACAATPALAARLASYRAAARREADYAERYDRDHEPESEMGGGANPARSSTGEGFEGLRRARDLAYEAVRAACPSPQSPVPPLPPELQESEVAD